MGLFSIAQLAKVNAGARRLGTNWMLSTNLVYALDHTIQYFRRSSFSIMSTEKADMDNYEKRMADILVDDKIVDEYTR